MNNSKYRFLILQLVMIVMLAAIVVRLFSLQILDGEKYLKTASARLVNNIIDKAPRGDILDRFGNVLVTNKAGYAVTMQCTTSDTNKMNSIMRNVAVILNRTGVPSYGSLPVSMSYPYRYEFEDKNNSGGTEDEKEQWFKTNKYTGSVISSSMSAEQLITALARLYGITDDVSNIDVRGMIGIRYDADIKEFSSANPLTVADNVGVETVTQVKEFGDHLPGVFITENYIRTYNHPGLATHILGRVGSISSEEYEKYSKKGYGMNEIIGKQGIELWAESYLRGKDGISSTTASVDGQEVEIAPGTDPIPGNYVMLTIDSELQETLEQSLENTVKAIGHDCNAGAAAVLDVNNGDVLAMGSYPTYDMSRFNEDYAELVSNESNPMINRAVSGMYSPGSTFKPLTAIAGIQTGNLALWEKISCTGVYRFYKDYQPVCWLWSEAHATHGAQDVTLAIENSCNVFFYELGRRLGIDALNEYAKKFGLGEYTGIELTEEAKGHMASPEYKKQVVENAVDRDWFGGDTIQAAIGQSYSLFTPVQLANYCATVANGGTRYKVNLIDSIRSSVDGKVVEAFDPQVVEELNVEENTMRKIHDGMRKVVDEGSASSIFDGYPIAIGGKTGTAQLGKGANNAIFIAFAPFDNPQIAVAVVLEHGERGTNAGLVARDVFNKYFFGSNEAPAPTQKPEGTIR